MRAVNLLPPDHRRTKGAAGMSLRGPAVVVVGALALALGLVTVYVVTNNSVADQKSKLAVLQQQVPQVQAMAARLGAYTQFTTLAQQRAQTVRQIAATRFDWAASMSDLAKVVPANTSLQALSATAGTSSPGGAGSAAGSAGTSNGIRTALPNPAFDLRGCTGSQDDVARLMSRLRLMNGVVRVTLSTAAKQGSTGQGSGATVSSASTASSSLAGGKCPGNSSGFDIVVFFTGPSGSAPSGSAPSGSAPSASAPSTGAAPSSAPPPGTPPGGTGQSAPTGGSTP